MIEMQGVAAQAGGFAGVVDCNEHGAGTRAIQGAHGMADFWRFNGNYSKAAARQKRGICYD